jgi:archaellum component FlaC
MEKQFITEEEKSKFENLRSSEEQIVIGLGQIEFQIQSLMLEKENIKNQLSQLKQTQITLGKELTEKYGDGNVDLTTGEFTKI